MQKVSSYITYYKIEYSAFSELQTKLPNGSKRMLTKQVAELETDAIFIKHRYVTVPVKSDD